MRVLIACEFSAVVRNEFRKNGCDAWSCDLLESEGSQRFHIRRDVLEVIGEGWDLMIAHPPCTFTAVSGARWNVTPARQRKQRHALRFVRKLMKAPIDRIGLEQPISVVSTKIRKPDQIVQPWWFGEDASKSICLWLKGLPLLQPTNVLPGDRKTRRANQTPSGQNKLGPSPDRWRNRSRTYRGLAVAMAAQWGRVA